VKHFQQLRQERHRLTQEESARDREGLAGSIADGGEKKGEKKKYDTS